MRRTTCLVLLVACPFVIFACGDVEYSEREEDAAVLSRFRRADNDPHTGRPRKACEPGDDQPVTRVDSSESLALIRHELEHQNLDAFLIPSGDSHQSEYIHPRDHRVKFASGFSGKGFAVVTKDKAALWTDGRYFLQADDQLNCDWHFFAGIEGGSGGPIDWVARVLPPGARVGADPTINAAFTWLEWEKKFEEANLKFIPMTKNLIDEVWPESERPQRSADELEIHDVKYAGRTWQDKVSELRDNLESDGYDAIVISGLDETAWLFNLRGRDIPYSPVFRSYGVVSKDEIILYIDPERQTEKVKMHLNSMDCSSPDCVQLRDYDSIFDDLPALSRNWESVLMGKKWGYTQGPSYGIYRVIPEEKIKFDLSPVMLTKSKKNEVEVKGMISANIRDAVALIDMAATLEEGMANGEEWDELKVVNELRQRRSEQDLYQLDSFKTISAYGPNGAVIHYKPNDDTNARIGRDSLFLLDSGGQYLDGTTDVTRTFHYGDEPTAFMREAYTRVLMGSIDLARAVFMKGTPDTRLDTLARWHLHSVGLNYRHGTGHGIGAYGLIHESPIQVRVYAKQEHEFEVGQFFSDEPGYYQAGEFGIRLETVLRVVNKTGLRFESKDDYGPFLGFEPVCLVPFEPKLIDFSLLNLEQIDWLNRYNRLIREKVGPELQSQKRDKAYDWMMDRTKTIKVKEGRRSGRGINAAHSSQVANLLLITALTIIAAKF